MSDLDFDPLLKRVHRVLQMLPKAAEALDALRNLEALEHSHLGYDLDRRFAQRRIFGARDLFDVATLLGPVRRALDAEWHQVVIDEEGMVRPVVERQRTTRGAEIASATQQLFALEADLQDLLALRRAEEVAMKLRMETCS